jgi:SAM-dependent methyltransferase
MDEAVSDVFGFHALQLGLPGLEGLRANRMPHRWLACSTATALQADASMPGSMVCEYDALPFASQSLDLVVMPHTLELSRDPHLALREAERVLVPEGRLMITAFNPASWWAITGSKSDSGAVHPETGADGQAASGPLAQGPGWPLRAQMLGFRRLRDWLRLLSFEVEAEDRHLPVALASMGAKFVRELFMRRLNAFFAERKPGLAPTAGYVEDGRRFLAEVKPILLREAIPEAEFARVV